MLSGDCVGIICSSSNRACAYNPRKSAAVRTRPPTAASMTKSAHLKKVRAFVFANTHRDTCFEDATPSRDLIKRKRLGEWVCVLFPSDTLAVDTVYVDT